MHPDKKVGLALGILLIGITGAFFFRNDAAPRSEETLTLSDPESLDRKVSQKPGAPYFPVDERRKGEEQLDLANVPESLASDVVPHVGSSSYRGILPAPVNNGDGGSQAEHFADRITPLPLPGRDLDGLDGVLSGRGTGGRLGVERLQASGVSRPGFITHEVVEGDNLSRLAKKYLGSHSKYLTLYEANRDLLASPDDLSPGMLLKIPQDRDEATVPSSRTSDKSSASTKTRSRGTVVNRLTKPSFVQPDRASVIALGGGRRTGRSLSQTPPSDLPRVAGLSPDGDPAVIASRPE